MRIFREPLEVRPQHRDVARLVYEPIVFMLTTSTGRMRNQQNAPASAGFIGDQSTALFY